jgi:hypothetical protein
VPGTCLGLPKRSLKKFILTVVIATLNFAQCLFDLTFLLLDQFDFNQSLLVTLLSTKEI